MGCGRTGSPGRQAAHNDSRRLPSELSAACWHRTFALFSRCKLSQQEAQKHSNSPGQILPHLFITKAKRSPGVCQTSLGRQHEQWECRECRAASGASRSDIRLAEKALLAPYQMSSISASATVSFCCPPARIAQASQRMIRNPPLRQPHIAMLQRGAPSLAARLRPLCASAGMCRLSCLAMRAGLAMGTQHSLADDK